MRLRQITLSIVLSALVLTAFFPTSSTSQNYPNRVVRLLVGYGAGSATDVFARTCAKMLEARLGQPVVVENRPGAGALIAANAVKRAAPDGYTLLWVNNGEMTVLPVLQSVDFDPLKDFVPLAAMVNLPAVYVAGSQVPAANMNGFVRLAKEKPGTFRWGSPGIGSGAYILGEMLTLKTGIDVTHIPYKGGNEVLTALLRGEVDTGIQALGSVAGQVQAGDSVSLASTSKDRLPGVDAPTMVESGYPNFVAASWWGVVGPAGLPQDVSERLERELIMIALSKEFRDALSAYGPTTAPLARKEFVQLISRDLRENEEVITHARAAGHLQDSR